MSDARNMAEALSGSRGWPGLRGIPYKGALVRFCGSTECANCPWSVWVNGPWLVAGWDGPSCPGEHLATSGRESEVLCLLTYVCRVNGLPTRAVGKISRPERSAVL